MPDIGNVSSGEANTASNVGSQGEGLFKQKSGVDLQFRNIDNASSKVSVSLNAGANTVDIDTPNAAQINTTNVWGDFDQEFYDDRLIIWNNARTFKYTVTAQDITASPIIRLPLVGSGTHTLMSRLSNDALENKELDLSIFGNTDGNVVFGTGSENPYTILNGIHTTSTFRRGGIFDAGCSNCGHGIFAATSATVVIGTNTNILDTAEGRLQRYATGATSGNNAGLRWTATYFRRQWNSYMIGRIKLSTTSNIRCFWGWSSSNAEIAGEDPLNGFEGCGIGKRVADTNWQIMKNDGTGATVLVDTGIAVTTSFVVFQIQLDSTNFRSQIGANAENTAQTTEIPASATNLFTHWEIETSDAVDKNIEIMPAFGRTGGPL